MGRQLNLVSLLAFTILASGCLQQTGPAASSSSGSSTSTSGTTTTTTASLSSGPNAFQLITKADPAGSFDAVAVPVAGGLSLKYSRIFNLDGSVIATGNIPTWFSDARAFLTSTRTSAGAPTNVTSQTACAYFDTFTTDNNPDSSGFYTIDGYNATSTVVDIDQCAGTAAAELNQLGLYIKLDRRFMTSTEKVQVIVKAKAIDSPNTTPTTQSCVVAGFFDGSVCSNQYFTITMRSAPAAAAKPFYVLFPSAKALDLLSEAILLPLNIDSSLNTISIDRVKGGAIIYGITVIKL